MNTEIHDLERRVATHAALADAARLRIVDLLTLGDLSPGELQATLGMTSNLMAHHLKVLDDAGIITRRRSEADRRRSYVQLRSAAIDGLAPGISAQAQRVLFVCTANSARSQLAAALWQRASDIPVASAGTHPAPNVAPGAVGVASRHGLALTASAPRLLSDVLSDGDLIVTVCDYAHEELGASGLHWSVPDPVRQSTDAAFDAAFDDLAHRIEDLVPRLTAA